MLDNHDNVMRLNADYGGACKFRSSLEDQVRGNTKDLYMNAQKIHYPVTAPVPRPGIELADSNEVLCEQCKELDIDKIFAPMERHSHKGKDIASLGDINEKSVKVPCPLCRLFAAVRVETAAQLDYLNYCLQGLSFLDTTPEVHRFAVPRDIQVRDCICLVVIPRRSI